MALRHSQWEIGEKPNKGLLAYLTTTLHCTIVYLGYELGDVLNKQSQYLVSKYDSLTNPEGLTNSDKIVLETKGFQVSSVYKIGACKK